MNVPQWLWQWTTKQCSRDTGRQHDLFLKWISTFLIAIWMCQTTAATTNETIEPSNLLKLDNKWQCTTTPLSTMLQLICMLQLLQHAYYSTTYVCQRPMLWLTFVNWYCTKRHWQTIDCRYRQIIIYCGCCCCYWMKNKILNATRYAQSNKGITISFHIDLAVDTIDHIAAAVAAA